MTDEQAEALVRAGWLAALEVHAHHGMAGWSSHKEKALKEAIDKAKPSTPSPAPKE